RDRLADGGNGPGLAVLAPGNFTMGGDRAAEQPARPVTLARGLAISIHETSVAEYRAFCTATGHPCAKALAGADDAPVVNVSWHDARAYAAWLSEATGQRYRLPAEAEWEYAARGGTTTRYPFGDDILPTHARYNYAGNVESPLPRSDQTVNRNRFRLYHMVGNVREWTLDPWSDTHAGAPADGTPRTGGGDGRYTVRGGSYADGPDGIRSASRAGLAGDSADALTGFRVVRELR
ncbi:MAG: formylglycine-generating enzyme family protein, partial [Gammaproteobacteria bacterium]|nr:formylglycine-generating enzyme family protein [Gammaproteobacteria bacterium]